MAAVGACAEAELPVFLGVRHITEEGRMQYGDSFEEFVNALKGCRVDAILLMCSTPEAISAGLPLLRDAFDGLVVGLSKPGLQPDGAAGQQGEADQPAPEHGA